VPVAEPDVEIIGPDGFPIGVVRRPQGPVGAVWINAVLLAFTFLSTTIYGAVQFGRTGASLQRLLWWGLVVPPRIALMVLSSPTLLVEGLWFSIPLLMILVTHEAGHYVACRAHRLNATLPFFIPAPFGIGTLGAFIRIRSPLLTRAELMDVGASGPLAGFLVTLPLLVAGIALSRPVVAPTSGGYAVFGEPLAFQLLGHALHPALARGADLELHPLGMAAWFGLLVTALNLLPFGQLDGGHVTYALFGRVHRRLAWPLLAVLALLGFLWPGWWLWAVIALAMGVRHPWLPDERGALDTRRRILGWACIVVFLLAFTPAPVTIVP
jgi:membrane-associated protease RseP (regulator of RpoE activity)